MKNSLKFLALAATSALALVSCQKSEIQESPVTGDEVFFSLTTSDHLSEAEDSGKTYMGYDEGAKNYKPYWRKGDKIGVFFNGFNSNRSQYDVQLENSEDDGATAQFTGTTTKELAESGNIYAYYPSSISVKTYADQVVGFVIPATQHPTATSFDPAADLLIAKPVGYTLSGETTKTVTIGDVQFARALAILRLNLYTTDFETAKDAPVTKLTVTSEGNILGGQPKFDITKDNSARIIGYDGTSPSVSVEYDDENNNAGAVSIGAAKGEGGYAFLVVAPADSLKGEKLVVEGEIEGYTFRKTIESLPSSIVLRPGRVLPVAVSLSESNFEVKKPETRLYVEGFDKCSTTSEGKQYQPFAGEGIDYGGTGVFGLGVEEGELNYVYSADKCNIRNASGKVSGDPYLYINEVTQYFRIQKLNVPEDMQLKFSAWIKNNGTLTVKIQPSSSGDESWENLGNIAMTSNTGGAVYSIISADTYPAGQYDFELNYSAKGTGYLYVDDIVIEQDPRAILDTPVVDAQIDDKYSNKINVTWNPVENAGSYEVTLQKDGAIDFVVEITDANSISFSGLDYETKYYVKVKAISSDITLYKDSVESEWKAVTTEEETVTVDWKAKSFADLAEGDEVVIVGIKEGSGSRALADNPKGATDPAAVSVSFTNDMLDDAPADSLIWTVGVSGENRIFYTDDTKSSYLFCNTNGVRVGTHDTENNRIFSWDSNYLKNAGRNKHIGIDFDDEVWKAGSATAGNSKIKGETFKFFVKDDPRTQLATPEITVTPQSLEKKITVSWTPVANAASYSVTCTGQNSQTVTLTPNCAFTELEPGEYTVTVTAKAQPGSAYKDSQAASETVTIEDTTPVISYTAPETAEAGDTSIEFAYEVTWPREGVELQVTKVEDNIDWITDLSADGEKVHVTITANETEVARQARLKLSYTGAEDKTLYINQNGVVTEEYASLADLVAAGKPTTDGKTVKVTFADDEISRISGKNLFFMVGEQEIEIYCNASHPSEWGTVKEEGKISGTITCPWKLYVNQYTGETWELCPADWTGLSYTAPLEPCATPGISISDGGEATITCATEGATIYYAIGENEPTEFTQEYTSAVQMTDGQTIWAQAKKEGYNKPSAVASRTYTAGGGGGYSGPLATWGNTAFTVTDNLTYSKVSTDLCGTNATLGAKSSEGTLLGLTKTSHNSGAIYVVYYEAPASSYWEITLPITEKIVSGTKINLSYNAAVNSGGITSWTAYCNENAMGDPVTIAENGTPKALSDLTAVYYSYTLPADVAIGGSIIIKIEAASSGTKKNTRITNISVSAN